MVRPLDYRLWRILSKRFTIVRKQFSLYLEPVEPKKLDLDTHICKREFTSIICSKCGYTHQIMLGSQDRTCPACMKKNYARLISRYKKPVLEAGNHLYMLTLTWKPVKSQDAKIVRSMRKALVKFLHRKPYRYWKGVLGVIECKKTDYGHFYYHLHLLYQGFFVLQAKISNDWFAVSGFPVVWVSKVRSPYRALKYVLKYVLKGFTFNEAKDRLDFKASMHGVRYISSYGSFYNYNYMVAPHVYFPCPNCEAVRCWLVWDFVNQVDLIEGEPYDTG